MAAAAKCIPLLTYSRRRIKSSCLEDFKVAYDAFAKSLFSSHPGVKAIFAFPEPDDALAYWHVCWSRDVESFVDDSAILAYYASTAEDPDTVDVYGGWNEATIEVAKAAPSLRHNFHKPLAGYMKLDGAGLAGPAMFGFTKRHVKPGMLDGLVASFPKVCELWYDKGNGAFCAQLSAATRPTPMWCTTCVSWPTRRPTWRTPIRRSSHSPLRSKHGLRTTTSSSRSPVSSTRQAQMTRNFIAARL